MGYLTVNHSSSSRVNYKCKVHPNECDKITLNIRKWISEQKRCVDEEWSDEERRLFLASISSYSKNFSAVKQLLWWRSMKDLVLLYYITKRVQNDKMEDSSEDIMTVRSLMSGGKTGNTRGSRLPILGIDKMGQMVKSSGKPLRLGSNLHQIEVEMIKMSEILSLRWHAAYQQTCRSTDRTKLISEASKAVATRLSDDGHFNNME